MHYSSSVDAFLEQRDIEPGSRLGDVWEVVRPLGRGGMGSVFACHNKDAPSIRVAVKVLTGFAAFHPLARKRFLREAELLHVLEHPNLVRVTDIDLDSRPPFLVMELVEGTPLSAVLREGPLEPAEAKRMLSQLADAVHYLHRRSVFHRDVKPENVMVRPGGTVVLVDFGLAKQPGLEITLQGKADFGTVEYCPPEWMEPEQLQPADWDCYALGVVFCEMLTGRVAFTAPSRLTQPETVLWVMADKQGLDGLDAGADVPSAYRRLVHDLTRLDPRDRVRTARDLVRRLEALP